MIPRSTIGLPNLTGSALYTRTPSQVSEFIVHYGDGTTPTTAAQELSILKSYDSYHRSKGWGGIGYNLAVGPVTGNVYEARGLNKVGAHTIGHNTSGIGVVLIGGEGNLTANAKKGLQEAYNTAKAWAGKTLTVYGHKDFANTSCPGTATYKWLKEGGILTTTKPTTYVNGRLVAAGTATAFYKLAAAFKAATGYTLHVRDGLRTYAQQKDLYDRWTGKKQPPFYAPSVAYPGTSLHETGRALDVYDSGPAPGVTTAGNVRSNWLRANAAKYGFSPTGYGFNEPWHIEYQGNPWAGSNNNNNNTNVEGFLMALTDAEQKKLFARITNIQDILTGYAPNQYVQKGYSLPLVGARVRDVKDLVTGGGPKGASNSLLRDILAKLDTIQERLDKLEGNN